MLPADLKYTKEHEWVRIEGNTATVGITDYAQGQLGDIVYVELPEVGSKVEELKPFGVIEAVKTVADLFAPLSGTVSAVNDSLSSDPTAINSSPYEKGWIIKMELSEADEISHLLGADDYEKLTAS